ncbi:MAG: amylo-alpha-1,6-glucosidase, partial [Gemmatimonadota bacterium]
MSAPPESEWLETDGLGGFTMGTVGGIRTRRYHALLTVALTPPTGRVVLVSGFDAWLERPRPEVTVPRPDYLTVQRYAPDVTAGSFDRVAEFDLAPWPTWTFRFADGMAVEQELFVTRGRPVVAIRWRLVRPAPGVRLVVRPFLAGRDVHALLRASPEFRFEAAVSPGRVEWHPSAGLPAIVSVHNGRYDHAPEWYRRFQLDEERARGFDFLEDAGSPGVLSWDLSAGDAVWILGAGSVPADAYPVLRRRELARRRRQPAGFDRYAEAYLVQRGKGRTIIAGYPWFTDWGRDTFIALRGLCLARGGVEQAKQILLEWAGTVSEGMLPNRFPDHGGEPEFNAVDASLWYVIAVQELLEAAADGKRITGPERVALLRAVRSIVEGYSAGTRYGIRMDADGLLAAGVPGVQLTWMDAKIDDWVVTPRIGKPVEVQALWINALRIAGELDPRWRIAADRASHAFERRFWNEERQCLFDVVDADHEAGKTDAAFRPNQIFAVGGLPHALLDGARARQIVDAVERELVTPMGLRSLARGEPGYVAHYRGGPRERDAAFHQGTVWPWLLGPFVEAWLRVHGDTPERRAVARRRFLEPLIAHLGQAGLGHVSEVADAEPPFTPGGCPFQA